jgi:hypothetical protein
MTDAALPIDAGPIDAGLAPAGAPVVNGLGIELILILPL